MVSKGETPGCGGGKPGGLIASREAHRINIFKGSVPVHLLQGEVWASLGHSPPLSLHVPADRTPKLTPRTSATTSGARLVRQQRGRGGSHQNPLRWTGLSMSASSGAKPVPLGRKARAGQTAESLALVKSGTNGGLCIGSVCAPQGALCPTTPQYRPTDGTACGKSRSSSTSCSLLMPGLSKRRRASSSSGV